MKTIVRSFLFIAGLISLNLLQGQSIVPNGNLEDVNICDEYLCPCSPSAWFIVKKGVPMGYYHMYPDHAASGKQYFNLYVVRSGRTRQYWQTMLLCKLVPGEKYDVSIKLSTDDIGPNLNDIGFYFSNNFIFSENDTLLQPATYLNFLDAKVSVLKRNWFQLKKEFTAETNAGYLIIGNFSAEDNESIRKKRNIGYQGIILKIDDINITPQHAANCLVFQKNKDSLYSITKRHSGDTSKTKETGDGVMSPKSEKSAAPGKPARIDTLQLSNVLFKFDHYKLINPDTLDMFRRVLSNPAIKKIQVAGYTDDAGSEAYNAVLSSKRAEEIAWLIAVKFDIDPSIIHAEGKGISTYYTDKSLNRRVDIYVYY